MWSPFATERYNYYCCSDENRMFLKCRKLSDDKYNFHRFQVTWAINQNFSKQLLIVKRSSTKYDIIVMSNQYEINCVITLAVKSASCKIKRRIMW